MIIGISFTASACSTRSLCLCSTIVRWLAYNATVGLNFTTNLTTYGAELPTDFNTSAGALLIMAAEQMSDALTSSDGPLEVLNDYRALLGWTPPAPVVSTALHSTPGRWGSLGEPNP